MTNLDIKQLLHLDEKENEKEEKEVKDIKEQTKLNRKESTRSTAVSSFVLSSIFDYQILMTVTGTTGLQIYYDFFLSSLLQGTRTVNTGHTGTAFQ